MIKVKWNKNMPMRCQRTDIPKHSAQLQVSLCKLREFINNSRRNLASLNCRAREAEKPSRSESSLQRAQWRIISNYYLLFFFHFAFYAFMKFYIGFSLMLEGCWLWNFASTQKTLEPFSVGGGKKHKKNPLKLALKCFPKTAEKSKWEMWKRSQRCQH